MGVDDVTSIAKGLIRYTRQALLSAAKCKGGAYWTPYQVHDTRLAKNGVLTPLGLAVRAHLQGDTR